MLSFLIKFYVVCGLLCLGLVLIYTVKHFDHVMHDIAGETKSEKIVFTLAVFFVSLFLWPWFVWRLIKTTKDNYG